MLEKIRPDTRHPAPDHHHLRVNHLLQVGNRQPDACHGSAHHQASEAVSRLRQREGLGGRDLAVQGVTGVAGNGRAARHRLQGTCLPRAADGAARHAHDVPQFPGDAVKAAPQPPAQHDAAANAGADRDVYAAAAAPRCAQRGLGQSRHLGVVFHRDAQPQPFVQPLHHGHVGKAEDVGGEHHPLSVCADGAGNTQAHRVHPRILLQQRAHQGRCGVEHGGPASLGSGRTVKVAYLAVHQQTHRDLGSADVDADAGPLLCFCRLLCHCPRSVVRSSGPPSRISLASRSCTCGTYSPTSPM